MKLIIAACHGIFIPHAIRGLAREVRGVMEDVVPLNRKSYSSSRDMLEEEDEEV
jgi:hypothetical protein